MGADNAALKGRPNKDYFIYGRQMTCRNNAITWDPQWLDPHVHLQTCTRAQQSLNILDFGHSAKTLQNVIIPHLLAALASRGLI